MNFFLGNFDGDPVGSIGWAALVFVIGFSMIGCEMNSGSPPNTAGNAAATGPAAGASPAEKNAAKEQVAAKASPCWLDYYPVSADTKSDYNVTGAGAESFSLAHSEVTDTGFVEKRTFSSGLVITNNWTCDDEGIRNVEFSNTGIMKSADFTVETLKSSGVTLPREVTVGKEFESSYDIKANVNVKGLKADATGKVNATSKVAAIDEAVSIGDKEYKAVRIDSVIRINLTVSGRGYEAANLKTTNWYAPGVGLVKQDTKSSLGSQVVSLAN